MRRTKILEILQALTFGALAGSLWDTQPLFQGAKPELLSALALYFGIFLLQSNWALLAWVTFAMVAFTLVKDQQVLDFARLCAFAPLLMVARRFGQSVATIICSILLWQGFLALYLLRDEWFLDHLSPLTSPVMISIIVEFVAMISFPLITASSFVSFCMGRPSVGVPVKSFLVHSTFVPLLLIVGGGFLLLRSWSGHGIQDFFGEAATASPLGVIAVFAILLVCLMLISMIANLVSELIETLVLASDPNQTRVNAPWDGKVFSDFAEQLSTVQNNVESMIRARKIVEDIIRISGAREESIPMRWEELERAERNGEVFRQTVKQFPGACLGMLATGKIVLATPGISDIMPYTDRQLIGENCSIFQNSEHGWTNDIFGVLSWACVEHKRFINAPPRKAVSTPQGEHYLEMLISGGYVEPERTPVGGKSSDPRSGILIVVLIRPTLDLRPLQLRLLHPNEFELAGTSAMEFSSDLRNGLQEILNKVQVVTTKMNNLHDASGQLFAETPSGGEIAGILSEMEREVDQFLHSVAQITERWSQTRDKSERCSLSRVTEASINYLFDLLGLERRVELVTPEDNSSAEAGRTAATPEVIINAASSEVGCFLSYLLLLVKTILPRVRDIHVELDYEQISSGAAALLTGSSPGRYARMTLSHKGQSVTANTISAQSDWLGVISRYSTDSTECSLFLLTRQVRRMGGFISVQSSTSRGTNICIYLPEDARRGSKSHSTNGISGAEPGLVGTGEDAVRQALVVSDDPASAKELSAMIASLSLEAHIRQAQDLLQEIVTPISFNGSGFSDSASFETTGGEKQADAQNLCDSTSSQRMNFEPFRLLIFDSKKIDFDILTLLDELSREDNRMVKVLLLEDQGMANSEILKKWKVVLKPVDSNYLRTLVEKLVDTEDDSAETSGFVQPA